MKYDREDYDVVDGQIMVIEGEKYRRSIIERVSDFLKRWVK